jgi:formate transporter
MSSSPTETIPASPAPVPQLVANADQILPPMMLKEIVADAVKKDKFTVTRTLLSGFLCTPFLAYAVALSVSLVLAGWSLAAAGLIFPVGFVMMVFLGLEMATGSFSVMPMGVFAGLVKWSGLIRNWTWTLVGNLAGGIFFAFLLWFALTKGASIEPSGILVKLARIAEAKASYENFGINGWMAAVGMGILCNWLVSLGPIFAKASRSVPGKIMLMWLPIATFFALGFEHAIVNMFVFPIGILSGADVTIGQWWMWNQIPVTLGNILGALIFNSCLWYSIHKPALTK